MRNFKEETRICKSCGVEFTLEQRSNRQYCDLHKSGKRGVPVVGESDDPTVIAARKYERAMEENRQLRMALKAAQKEDIKAEQIREKMYELAGNTPDPPSWLYESTKGGTPGVPSTTWSDWHFGEVVRPEEVGYVNEFNTEIGQERARDLVESIIDLSYTHMVNPVYPGIVVNVAGDMITGDIHEELQDTNDRYTFQSMLDVQDSLIAGLTLLADKFGHVFVPAVIGNHGRNTKRFRMKGRAFTSFEWHMYQQIERHFKAIGDTRIQMLVSNEADAHYRIYDHRYLVTHGDSLGVKGGDGIIGSLGPIMRGAIKVGRAEQQIGRDFDTIVMGHWHQLISLRGIEVNGSLKGYDEYARLGLRAPYERPTQALWFTHYKYGVTAKWSVYLQDEEKPSGLDWISWQRA